MFSQIVSVAALFAAGASAHGRVTSPTPRPLGTAMKTACGQQVYNQMSSDPAGNIQGMAQTGKSQSDFDATACHLWQCRGYQFADATSASIQSYTAGQSVAFTVNIVAPHTGVANVSVINLASNSVIGDALISWTDYASTATGVTSDETSFSVTIPSNLPSTCSTAGGCALQWWWDARSIDQTYMSCIDFTVGSSSSSGSTSGGSSSSSAGSGSGSGTTAAASTAATSKTAAATTATSKAAAATSKTAGASSKTAAASSKTAAASSKAAATTKAATSAGAGSTARTSVATTLRTVVSSAAASSETNCSTATVTVTMQRAAAAVSSASVCAPQQTVTVTATA